jgi:hypothetical protein
MALTNLNDSPNTSMSGVARAQKDNFSRCGKCNCSWFEEVTIGRIVKNHVVVVGQHPPRITGPGPFIMLKCVACGTLNQPNITAATGFNDAAYTEMLKEINPPAPVATPVPDGAKSN